MKISKNSLKYIYIYIHIYICIYIYVYILYIHIYILHILYIYYICLIFWLGRDGLWTRNLEISFKVCSEILFCWGLHCVKAGLLFIIFYVLFIYLFLCFIYLFIYLYCFISYFFGFYTDRVAVERCFHIYFSFRESIYSFTYLFGGAVVEFIFGTVACWWHVILSTMKCSAPLQDCPLWGSVFPVKTMVTHDTFVWFVD